MKVEITGRGGGKTTKLLQGLSFTHDNLIICSSSKRAKILMTQFIEMYGDFELHFMLANHEIRLPNGKLVVFSGFENVIKRQERFGKDYSDFHKSFDEVFDCMESYFKNVKHINGTPF